MKKIRERFTIVERLIFLFIFTLLIIIVIPIISDKIEKPKRDKAEASAEAYIKIVNNDISKLKEYDINLYNEILKYNSFNKFCSIKNEEEQILKCDDIEIGISSDSIIAGLDSVIYFSSDGVVAGYKLIVNNYKVIYPNSNNLKTIKRYKKPKEKETVELKSS